MARFDVYPNPIKADRDSFPFVMEVQSDLLHRFAERVCVPLATPGAFPGMTDRFNPVITVARSSLRLHPLGIAVFLVQELQQPADHARSHALDIETAMDMLFRGY